MSLLSMGAASAESLNPTYDANGYMQPMQVPDYGTNPWSPLVAGQNANVQAANGAQAQLPKLGQDLGGQIQNLNNYANSTAYPATPNAFGLGAPLMPMQQDSSQGKGDPSDTSRGFNPWSLQGEALSR